jgi:hypothetical protein
MRDDFQAALARVQSDYDFYIRCQSNPATALADYALSPEERAALSDPDRLADLLNRRRAPRGLTITISGTHDWVNRAAPQKEDPVDELIAQEVESVKQADNDDERRESALRLIHLIG